MYLNFINQAEIELQKATVKFQRTNSLYKAAKETVSLAEQRMNEKTSDDANKPEFDSAWQEMMNYATLRVKTSRESMLCVVICMLFVLRF